MKLLHAMDDTLIVLNHVVTLGHGMDHEAYRIDSLRYMKAEREIAEAGGHPDIKKALEEGRDAVWPNGKPEYKDFFRTKVTLSDGNTYWVRESIKDVRLALLDA